MMQRQDLAMSAFADLWFNDIDTDQHHVHSADTCSGMYSQCYAYAPCLFASVLRAEKAEGPRKPQEGLQMTMHHIVLEDCL